MDRCCPPLPIPNTADSAAKGALWFLVFYYFLSRTSMLRSRCLLNTNGFPVWAPPVNVNLDAKATDCVCLSVDGEETILATEQIIPSSPLSGNN